MTDDRDRQSAEYVFAETVACAGYAIAIVLLVLWVVL